MKKFLLFVLVVGAAGWIAQKKDMLPFQDSAPYAAFQGFATAMVRADMDTVGKFALEKRYQDRERQGWHGDGLYPGP